MTELGVVTSCYSIRYERRSPHSASRLWAAITEPEQVAQWMTCPARIDLRIGGDYHIDFSQTDSGELNGVIVRFERERRLAYAWGLSVLEWTLEPDGDGCRYTFVHHGQPPGLIPDEAGIAAGWHAWLDDFAAHLEGSKPSVDDDGAVFEALLPMYRPLVEAALATRNGDSKELDIS